MSTLLSMPGLFSAIGDHLWQSTLIGGIVALLALALRHNSARVRYWLWLAASIKFLVPFAALVAIGSQITWRTVAIVPYQDAPVLIETMSQPFSQNAVTLRTAPGRPTARPIADALPALAIALWAIGCTAFFAVWLVRWRRMHAIAKRATPLDTGKEVAALRRLAPRHRSHVLPIVASETPIEPGIFGIHRPVLLWPRGISERLTDEQVEAILAHELCHLRRRDNLAAAVHMVTQAIFWFHPLVWWIGARLVDERERACDEDVIRLGSEPEVYAESILKTCQFFVESPLVCVAGVTGSDLKTRIEQIMTNDARQTLSVWRKALLVAAGTVAFVTPVAVGALNPPPQTRAMPAPASLPAFEAISIRPNITAGRGGRGGGQLQPGRYIAANLTLRTILRRAFGNEGSGPGNIPDLFEAQVAGGPAWLDEDKFDIEATTSVPMPPAEMRLMLQRLLADRFKLTAHWETRELPVYLLTKARADGTLGMGLTATTEEECASRRSTGAMPPMPPAPGAPAPALSCGFIQFGPGSLIAGGIPMEWLASTLTNVPVVTGIDRMVLDRTGITGRYGFTLRFAAAASTNADPDRPELFTALREQLGLKLEATRAPVDVLVVDRAEKPEPN